MVAGAPALTVTAPAEQNPPVSIPLAETGADVTITATTTAAAWFGGLAVTAQSGQNTLAWLSPMRAAPRGRGRCTWIRCLWAID